MQAFLFICGRGPLFLSLVFPAKKKRRRRRNRTASGQPPPKGRIRHQAKKRIRSIPRHAIRTLLSMSTGQYFLGTSATPRRRPMY